MLRVVVVLSLLALGAVGTATVLPIISPSIANAAYTTTVVTKKIIMSNETLKILKEAISKASNNSELLSKALKIASKNPEFKKLINEGYKVVKVLPVLRLKGPLINGVLKASNVKVRGAILILEKDGKEVDVSVYFDTGEVIIAITGTGEVIIGNSKIKLNINNG